MNAIEHAIIEVVYAATHKHYSPMHALHLAYRHNPDSLIQHAIVKASVGEYGACVKYLQRARNTLK